MPETITWNFLVRVPTGPRVAGADAIQLGSYEKITVDLETDEPVEVGVNLAGAAVLVINPSELSKATYRSGTDLAAAKVLLDGPLVLLGKSAVLLLGGPTLLIFAWADSAGAPGTKQTVEILIGREGQE